MRSRQDSLGQNKGFILKNFTFFVLHNTYILYTALLHTANVVAYNRFVKGRYPL